MSDTSNPKFSENGFQGGELKKEPESLDSYFRTVCPDTLKCLLPEVKTHNLYSLMGCIPLGVTSLWGFEIPLYRKESHSDFLLCVHDPHIFNSSLDLEEGWRGVIDEPYYTRLRQLTQLWAEPRNRIGKVINNFWFEFDHAGMDDPILTPNFFYGPGSQCHSFETLWATRQLFGIVEPEGLPTGVFRSLAQCMTMLSDGGTITQIGQMVARRENRLRIFIQHIPDRGILPFLKRMEYRHVDNPDLLEQLKWSYQLSDSVDLDLDLSDDTLGESIGLECYFTTLSKASIFLDNLYERGLCEVNKYKNLQKHLQAIPAHTGSLFEHGFSHFKLGFHPEKGIVAKAYLGYVDKGNVKKTVGTNSFNSVEK